MSTKSQEHMLKSHQSNARYARVKQLNWKWIEIYWNW